MSFALTISADTHERLKQEVAGRGNAGEAPEDLAEAILDSVLNRLATVLFAAPLPPSTANWAERKADAGGAAELLDTFS